MPPAAGEIAADLDGTRRPDADDGPPDVDDRHTARAGAMRATVSPRRPPYIALEERDSTARHTTPRAAPMRTAPRTT